jgi:hypothetical protein
MAACGGGSSGDGATGGDVVFHAEAPALPGFSYDTGLQPPAGPAQVSLSLTATGNLVADATATESGGKISGKPGSTYKLDMHVKLGGHLKVAAGTVNYDGDLPGVQGIDIPIAGTSPFDGLLLDGDPVKVSAPVPETKLPDIPLGTVPGHLSITVANGTVITSSFHGSCLTVKAGQATFAGATTTAGTIVLKASIVLEIPLFKKSIDLPPITVNVPESKKELDSAPVKVSVADATAGTCSASPGGDGGAGGDGGGTTDSGTNGDSATSAEGGTCQPANVQFSPVACDACVHSYCQTQLDACFADTSPEGCACQGLMICIQACSDDACAQQCASKYPAGVAGVGKVDDCLEANCAPSDGGSGPCQ